MLATAVVVLLAASGCRTLPPTTGIPAPPVTTGSTPGGRTGSSTVATTARYEAVPFSALPAVSDTDLLAALPAWRSSCAVLSARRAGPRGNGAAGHAPAEAAASPDAHRPPPAPWQALCDAVLAAAALGDGAALRTAIFAASDAYQIIAVDRRDDAVGNTSTKTEAAVAPVRRDTGVLTAYFEPQLQGRRAPDARFKVPLHRRPDDLLIVDFGSLLPQAGELRLRGRIVEGPKGADGRTRPRVVPYGNRADLLSGAALHGNELVWVEDPLEAFFLQVQGSGRIAFDDGSVVRLAYDEVNGRPYVSIGRWLVEQGELSVAEATVPGIVAWARAHPQRVDELLNQNPSYVFFKALPVGDPSAGPVGALGVPLTAGYSVACDPRWIPAGAPLLIDSRASASDTALTRIVLAQDAGGAIKGPLRADLFAGSGPAAGDMAGVQRAAMKAWLLVPRGVRPEDLLPPPPR